jgi:hypothetical protein
VVGGSWFMLRRWIAVVGSGVMVCVRWVRSHLVSLGGLVGGK